MSTETLLRPEQPALCPVHAAAVPTLSPQDTLRLPRHQRMVTQYSDADDGRRTLHLFYDDQEISFDEPELFVFGETLARQSRFAAGDAAGWGEPGGWPRVRELLLQLIDAGVLLRAVDDDLDDERFAGDAGARPSPLPPARTDRARTWQECPQLMQEIAGRPLDLAWLELVVPIFRVAHMSLDADGRQVGEANAFPARLRIDVPTRWRTCIYPGSRYQHDKPMNVTALKAMRAHWSPMMALLLKVREAYLRRCPDARDGWSVGHLERMSTAVLTLPAYQLMRSERPVQNGALHPVVSSLFRVTDGLRMTMHHMLFIPFGEPTRRPDTPMTAAEVHAYAERAFSFISDHGVCAGPKAMVDEFLAVAVDGQTPRDGLPATLAPELDGAVTDIEPALDYAMLGLKAYAAIFSVWPITMRAYEQLASIVAAWVLDEPSATVQALHQRLQAIVAQVRAGTHLATEQWRADRERVYGDMYAQCHRALTGRLPAQSLSERLRPRALPAGAAADNAWSAAFERRFGAGEAGAPQQHRAALRATLLDYVLRVQAVLRVACEVQQAINRHLGRTAAARPFKAADIDLYVQLAEETQGRVPFLLDELQPLLGVCVDIDAETLAIVNVHDAAPAVAPRDQDSDDIGSTGTRAFARI